MTICVGIQVNDCLVFAADSAVTLSYGPDATGADIINVLPHGNKVFNLHRDLPICAMFCGLGNIGSESIASLAKDLRVRLMVRHVVLTDEAKAAFEGWTADRTAADLMFLRADGDAWGTSHQKRPLEEASARAGITPAVNFHILRHTHGSHLAMNGVPMGVIAAQLGHADTRMTEKHYAHLAPSYVAQTIRANFPVLGIADEANVVPLQRARRA